MTIEQIRKVYQAIPFQPFVMHLTDGREIAVRHRDFLAEFPRGRTIVVTQRDSSFNIIDLLLVTDLEFKPLSSNGKKRKRGA